MRYLSLLMVALFLVACKTPEDTAYKATGVVVVTVATAMSAYKDAVDLGLISADKQAKVHDVYNKYYAMMQIENKVITAYKTNADTNALYQAVAAVSAASADVIGLIEQFLPPEKLIKLKGAQ